MVNVKEFSLCDISYNVSKKYIKREKTTYEYINLPCAFDIETSNTEVKGTKFAFMYEWTFGIGNKICYGRTWEEFIDLCKKLKEYFELSETRILVCYIHSMTFEFQFMRKYFDWVDIFSTDERKPIRALSSLGIEFRDSYILTGLSLEKTAEQLVNHDIKKLKGNLDYDLIRTSETPLTDEELAYCNNDVEILLDYIQEQIEEYGNITKVPLTNTSRVRKFVKKNCLYAKKSDGKLDKSKNNRYRKLINEMQLTIPQYLMLKRAFRGGYVNASLLHKNTTLENMDGVDFISSYAYAMLSEKYPMGNAIQVDLHTENFWKVLENKRYCYMFDVRFIGLHSKLTYESYLSSSKCTKLQGGVVCEGIVYQADLVQTTITDVDFEIIRKVYDWEEIQVGTMYKFYKEYLPKQIITSILDLYGNKTKLKGIEEQKSKYLLSKGMVSSVFGMTVTDIIRKDVVYNVDDDNWESEKLCENDYLNSLNIYNNGRDRFLSYPWGVWVTAYARRNLWTGILAFGRDYVYSDTDSIKAINFDKHLDYIEKYNQVVEMKLRKMCEFRKIDFELCRPKNIKGETKLLGAWEYETKDNKYIKFKTLGTKKYMYLDNEGLHITVAGLSKSVGVEYILNKCNNDYDKCFEFFNNDMYIPPEHSGKLQHTYIDDEFETEITDYLGHKTTVKSLSYVHLEKCDFSLNKSHRYGKILNMLMNGYIYKGVKTK